MSLSLSGFTTSVVVQENTVNATPVILDSAVAFNAPGPINGGTLRVTGLLAEDIIGIANIGSGAGQIDTSSDKVRLNGIAFGTFTGGNGTTLTVTFGPITTGAQVDALIQALTYRNLSDTPTANRSMVLQVQDTALGTVTAGFSINIIAENDAPVFTSGTTASVAENTTGVVYTAVAIDPESGTPGYTLGGADAALFSINAAGAVSFLAPPNFEVPRDAGGNNVYDITVTASDGSLSATRNVAITVTNVAEPPSLTGVRSSFTVAENTMNAGPQLLDFDVTFSLGEHLGGTLTISSTDPEDQFSVASQGLGPGQILGNFDTVRYEGVIFGRLTAPAPSNLLTFNLLAAPENTTGSAAATSVAVEALLERLILTNTDDTPVASRTITITYAAPNGGPTTSATITLGITAENDAPRITSGATARFKEDGTGIAYQAVGTDPEGTAITWSLAGVDAARFTIGAADGAVRFVAPPDFATPLDAGGNNVYDIIVRASDGGLVTEKAVAVIVTYDARPASLIGVGPAVTFAESAVNAAPRLLDPAVQFVAGNAPAGGTFVVGGLLAEDRVALQDQGNGPGQIGFSGGVVSHAGIAIGTATGGVGDAFIVALNAQATATAMDAMIQALTYANVSDTPTQDRTLTLEFVDAAGVPVNMRPVASFARLTPDPFSQPLIDSLPRPTATDLDGDGLVDLVVGRVSAEPLLLWFRNTGTELVQQTGALNPLTMGVADIGFSAAPAFADFDGDGRKDLVVGSLLGGVAAFRNNGAGFETLTGAANPFADINVGVRPAPAFADLNGDGRADLVLGSGAGGLRVWFNTATGIFEEQTGAANPFAGIDIGVSTTPTFGHLDADGRLDMVVGSSTQLVAFRNLPTGWLQLSDAMDPFGGLGLDGVGRRPVLMDRNDDGRDDLVIVVDSSILTYANVSPYATLPVSVLAIDDAPRGPRVVTLAPSAEDATRLITTAQLLAGWEDPEGLALSVAALSVVSDPAGTLVDNGNGTWSFTPGANDNSAVVFAFDVSDGVNTLGATARMDLTPVNDAPTGLVNVSMNSATGLLSVTAALADIDGLGEISFRWQGFTGGVWLDIAGATGATYTPAGATLGTLVRALATYTDGDGTAEAVPSLFVSRVGGAGNDSFAAPATASLQTGLAGNDSIAGSTQRDVLYGGAGNDSILGNQGNDIILGEAGADTLTGGAGRDTFRYLRTTDGGDTITDFTSGQDVIQLDQTFFKGLAIGTLAAGSFAAGAPTAAAAQVLYAGGVLRFDPDGTGVQAASIIATLSGAPALALADIVVIA
jgi:Ca2+-binding RTX toxin-like protein